MSGRLATPAPETEATPGLLSVHEAIVIRVSRLTAGPPTGGLLSAVACQDDCLQNRPTPPPGEVVSESTVPVVSEEFSTSPGLTGGPVGELTVSVGSAVLPASGAEP